MKKIKQRFHKQNEIQALLLSLGIGLTLCFFTPMEIYLNNALSFQLSYQEILPQTLCFALVCAAAIFLIFQLCLLIHQKIFDTVKCLTFGFLLAGYCQKLFYNGHMQQLNGESTDYLERSAYNITNFIVYFWIILMPFILYLSKFVKPKLKFTDYLSWKIIPYLCGLVIVMQTVGSISTFASYMSNDDVPKRFVHTEYLSYEPLTSLSPDHNIIVFLIDRMDGEWTTETLKRYPELYDSLEGFTYYPNNISGYTNTFPSVSSMLTGNEYDRSSWEGYLNRVWSERNITTLLHENQYEVDLIVSESDVFTSLSYLSENTDNIFAADVEYQLNYFGDRGIFETEITLSLHNILPYFMKELVKVNSSSNYIENFLILDMDSGIPDRYPGSSSTAADLKFNQYLAEHELHADSEQNKFCFVHLHGSHEVNSEIAALAEPYEHANSTYTIYRTLRGSLTIVEQYLEKMKEIGVYDSSTIIILGDHGHAVDKEIIRSNAIEDVILTGLMIKPAGAERNPLMIDEVSPLSNRFFAASILDYAGIDHSAYGLSYQDVITQGLDPDRYFDVYQWSPHSVSYVGTYTVNGDASDFTNWKYSQDDVS